MKKALFLAAITMLAVGCGDDDAPMADMDSTVAMDGTTEMDSTVETDGSVMMGSCPLAAKPAAGIVGGFNTGGQTRNFWLGLPSDGGPRPVFIAFNGTGETGPSFAERAGLQDFVDRGFIVASLSSKDGGGILGGNGKIWPIWDDMRLPNDDGSPNLDIGFFDDALSCLKTHFEVDDQRIYVGGHSAGGIFTNAVIQRRSNVIAGAIVASGIHDLTTPMPPQTLDKMFVIVTHGGANDGYSFPLGAGSINFEEQASIAAKFYEADPNVTSVSCTVEPGIGHMWYHPLNDWFVDRLLAHPKGMPGTEDEVLPEAPDLMTNDGQQLDVMCTQAPFEAPPSPVIACSGADNACANFCQSTADCVVENDTVFLPVANEMVKLGFPNMRNSCGTCEMQCNTAQAAGDDAIMMCINDSLKSGEELNSCGRGINGFLPYAAAMNTCCAGKTDAGFCKYFCDSLKTSTIGGRFFDICN